ncbi:MAG TPA: VTT domain-containing protein [Candidatus Binatia bacterium]|nr:VTT domain-containing protein [Candidatus Binatia bacterium]
MLNPQHLIASGGLLLIALLIFGESGMLIGFFFPGDTLLISAGVFAAQGKLPGGIVALIIVVAIAAIAGDNTGYLIGKHGGRRLFSKKDSKVFRHEYIEQTEKFYERFGSKTMLLAHFLPVIRTFAPIVAGIGRMPRLQFFIFDGIGDMAWAIIVSLIGYWFGSKIPNIDHYILLAVVLAIAFSFGPVVYHVLKAILHKDKPAED